MGKKKREQEIERDRQILAEALRELTAGVSLPETLSSQALLARMQAETEAKAGKKGLRRKSPRPAEKPETQLTPGHLPLLRRIGGWVRPMAVAAAVFFVCVGTLLAYERRGPSFSGAAMNDAAPAPAAAEATYDLAAASSSASTAAAATPQEQAQAAGNAPQEAIEKRAASPAGEEDGAQQPVSPEPAEDALSLEEELFDGTPLEEAQPTAAFGAGIAQVELRDGIVGGSSWQDEQYLYYLADPAGEQGMRLYIMQEQDMRVTASITVQAQAQAEAVVVFGDRLALISNEMEDAGENAAILRADIYDVADRSAPTLERTIRQDGVLAASVLQEDRLCLVSTCLPDSGEEAGTPSPPHVRDSLSQGEGALTEEQLLIPAESTTPCWTVLTLLSLDGEASPASFAIFGGADSLLLEGDRGYLAASQYGETVQSQIFSLSLEGGVPRQTASATLQGGLLLPQALTLLSDGLLAAVQEDGIRRFYRLDAALLEPTEVKLSAPVDVAEGGMASPPSSGSSGQGGSALSPSSGGSGQGGSALPPSSGGSGQGGSALSPSSGGSGQGGSALPPSSGGSGQGGSASSPSSGGIGSRQGGAAVQPSSGGSGQGEADAPHTETPQYSTQG